MPESMRDAFRQHHKLTESELDQVWRSAVFALDTNVLLNIYRYAAATREDLFRVLQHLAPRVWVPYQVASEFYARRIDLIREQSAKFDQISRAVSSALDAVNDGQFRKSGFLKVAELDAILRPAVDQALKVINEQREAHPDLLKNDPHLEKLVTIVGTSLGERVGAEQRERDMAKAESRIARKQPPGYLDHQKPIPDRYGDVLIWFELLSHAETTKSPVIFVTDDDKEDWWQIIAGQKQGPRPELRAEMREKAGVEFYILNPARLMERVGKELKQSVPESSIADAVTTAEAVRTYFWAAYRDALIQPVPGEPHASRWKRQAYWATRHWLVAQGYSVNISSGGYPDFLADKESMHWSVEVRLASVKPLYVDKLKRAIDGARNLSLMPLMVVFVARNRQHAALALAALSKFVSENPSVVESTSIFVTYLSGAQELTEVGALRS